MAVTPESQQIQSECPTDWQTLPLGVCGEVVMGQSPPGESYNRIGEGIPLINGPTEFTDRHPIKIQWTTQPSRLCMKGDLLICVRGSSTGRTNYSNGTYAIGRGVAAIRARGDNDTKFLSYRVIAAVSAILTRATGSTFPSVDGATFRNIPILLPLPPEQRAIATALSDVDALLDGLDRLIAKKREIKQAAMQQLLTGKTRLPGFEGEWEVLKAGNIGRFHGGSGFPIRYQGKNDGEYPFFKVSDMNNEGNDLYMKAANNYINEEIRKRLGAVAFPANSIVFAKVGAAIFLERKKILTRRSCVDNNMAALVLNGSIAHHRFVHYALLNKKLGDLVRTTALPSLSSGALAAIELFLPPPEEQIAISAVLSDMDAEIAVLEQRRAKTRDIKKAMMQELLTGRTRLV